MGLVRKTMSIGTLGMIPFRSKKERLRRAERAHADAEVALARERESRSKLEARIADAETQVDKTGLEALQLAKRLEKAKRARRNARGPSVTAAAADRGKKLGRKARRDAERSATAARQGVRRSIDHAKDAASSAKDALEPQIERVVERAEGALGHAVALGSSPATLRRPPGRRT